MNGPGGRTIHADGKQNGLSFLRQRNLLIAQQVANDGLDSDCGKLAGSLGSSREGKDSFAGGDPQAGDAEAQIATAENQFCHGPGRSE
jgi:hypothetical protein